MAWILPFSVFFLYREYTDFASIGFYVLIGVLSIRSLTVIFPNIKILRLLLFFRREFGIFSGMMIMAHFTGYLLVNNVSLIDVFSNKMYWDLSTKYLWGLLGVMCAIPVLLTSNKKAMIFLKSKWKSVQRLSYLFLLFGSVHVFFVGEWALASGVLFVAFLWIVARFKAKE